jgi:DNA-binding NtrC family response regulator
MSSKIRVLLVDDEEELTTYLMRRLSMRGFRVTGTTSGEEALAVARERDFDVAVVDLRMPEMDGEEVTRRLMQVQPMLQVVVLTGHASIESALECGAGGVFRYLSKPHDFDALVKVLKDATAVRRGLLRERYEAEMEEVLKQEGISPQVLLARWRALQKKYNQ